MGLAALTHIRSSRVLAAARSGQGGYAAMQSPDGCVCVDATAGWTVCVPVGPPRLTLASFAGGPEQTVPVVNGAFGVLPPGKRYSARQQGGNASTFVVYTVACAEGTLPSEHLQGFYHDELLAGEAGRVATALAAHCYKDKASDWPCDLLGPLIAQLEQALMRAPPGGDSLPAKLEAHAGARLSDALRVDLIARALGCSAGHLSRQCRAATGTSPHQRVMSLRIERAKLLLERTQWPLAEIALVCGFFDQSHFSSSFRRSTSLTPQQYRRSRSAHAAG